MRTSSGIGRGLAILAIMAAATAASAGSALAQGAGPGTLPFSNTYRRPVVNPYVNMVTFGANPAAAGNIYQQLVRPMQDQQQQQITQLQQGRELGRLQGQVGQMQRGAGGGWRMDQSIRPTGHAATYLNYSHYYPGSR